MTTPNHHVLMYYRSPAFAENSARHARDNPTAAHKLLSVTFEQLREWYRMLRHPPVEPLTLSEFLDGRLSVEQLVALVRTYAHKLSMLVS